MPVQTAEPGESGWHGGSSARQQNAPLRGRGDLTGSSVGAARLRAGAAQCATHMAPYGLRVLKYRKSGGTWSFLVGIRRPSELSI
jgi:hypothetical protein